MVFFPETASADAKRLIWAKGLRAIADGYVSIILPAYLLLLGHDSFEVGVLTTATLLGSATLTLLVPLMVGRLGHRGSLLAASGLMALTGVSFATVQAFWPLLLIAFVGTLNPSSGDVSIYLPLEQSLLTQSVGEKDRTGLFARYSLIGAPTHWLGIAPIRAMQGMFGLYAGLGISAGFLYRKLTDLHGDAPRKPQQPLGPSRGIVYRLAALFCVDAFGGGFFVQTILVLWLFHSFGLSVATAANIFFWSNLLTAASYLAAPAIARRFGLINTMVFTHLPSSLCLIAIPFVQNLGVVIGLLLVRSLLSQMDVPTRTSYVMAVVTPPSPVIAGFLITISSFGWPLLIGGMLKITYDLVLLAMFRHIQPPEERKHP